MSYAGNINIRSVMVEDAFNRSITADTDILSDWHSIVKQRLSTVGFYTIQISVDTPGQLYMVYRNPSDESTETIGYFMDGGDLNANALYIFTVAMSEPYEFNLRFDEDAAINYMVITSHGGIY